MIKSWKPCEGGAHFFFPMSSSPHHPISDSRCLVCSKRTEKRFAFQFVESIDLPLCQDEKSEWVLFKRTDQQFHFAQTIIHLADHKQSPIQLLFSNDPKAWFRRIFGPENPCAHCHLYLSLTPVSAIKEAALLSCDEALEVLAPFHSIFDHKHKAFRKMWSKQKYVAIETIPCFQCSTVPTEPVHLLARPHHIILPACGVHKLSLIESQKKFEHAWKAFSTFFETAPDARDAKALEANIDILSECFNQALRIDPSSRSIIHTWNKKAVEHGLCCVCKSNQSPHRIQTLVFFHLEDLFPPIRWLTFCPSHLTQFWSWNWKIELVQDVLSMLTLDACNNDDEKVGEQVRNRIQQAKAQSLWTSVGSRLDPTSLNFFSYFNFEHSRIAFQLYLNCAEDLERFFANTPLSFFAKKLRFFIKFKWNDTERQREVMVEKENPLLFYSVSKDLLIPIPPPKASFSSSSSVPASSSSALKLPPPPPTPRLTPRVSAFSKSDFRPALQPLEVSSSASSFQLLGPTSCSSSSAQVVHPSLSSLPKL